ncbi:DNA polymerase III subunit beta [candidate division TM6 bacterium RIFCSPHIGHO2_12_FULL_36_22]|nr:MAG: DNA polymerase III subunit beta [candidate division TM6 bacterium RIFCSPHIGHO2_12_FULL_36_22]
MENSFVIDQKALSSILAFMQPICAKRTTLDTTSSILFQAGHKELVLKSTDLEISLQYSCPLDNSALEGESFLLSGKRVFELIKELDGDINFVLKDNHIGIESGSARLALNIKNAQEFPPFPERIENLMHLDAEFLLTMLEKVAFLIPQNNANQALNGLFLEMDEKGLKMTATDGHCLVQVKSSEYTLPEPKSWLLPRRAIFELKKIIENTDDKTIFVGLCGNQLVFSGESFNFFTKLLADSFPHYAGIMEKEGFEQGQTGKTELTKALRRSTVLLSGQFIATQFSFKKTKLHISIKNKEVGALDESVELKNSKVGELDMRFYAPYLLNGIQVFNDETVTFWLQNASRPIIFESKEEKYLTTYLVMPVSPTNE